MNSKVKFVGAFLASALVFGGAAAQAWEIRRAHASCSAFTSTNFRSDGGNNGSGSLSLGCALPDENDLPHENIATLNVHFERPSGSASSGASRCVMYPFAAGSLCGAAHFPSGTGFITSSPSNLPSGWSDPANFAWLNVIVAPKTSGGAFTMFKGFYASN